jgi:hypothetical protein
MRVNDSTSSLAFGAAAAIGLVFAQHLGAPLIGSTQVLSLYLVGCTTSYLALLGSTPRRAVRNALSGLVGAGVVGALASGPVVLALGLVVVVAWVRSGLEYSMRPARAIVVEATLGLLGLGFASWVATPGWLGEAASLWAFGLVQSLYFLVPARVRNRQGDEIGDPFERASERILGLLDGP